MALLFPFITLKLLDTFWHCHVRVDTLEGQPCSNQLLIAFLYLQTCLLSIVGVPVPSGTTPSTKTTITTSIERTSTSENYKAPPPVAKKPQTEEPRYSTPTKKVITEEFRYQTTPPSQKTVMEEVRYSTTPTKRTVIEEEYRWETGFVISVSRVVEGSVSFGECLSHHHSRCVANPWRMRLYFKTNHR